MPPCIHNGPKLCILQRDEDNNGYYLIISNIHGIIRHKCYYKKHLHMKSSLVMRHIGSAFLINRPKLPNNAHESFMLVNTQLYACLVQYLSLTSFYCKSFPTMIKSFSLKIVVSLYN